MPAKFRRRSSTEERRLRSLLDVAPDAMVVVDQAGKVVLTNTQTEKLFGYNQEEILGLPVEVLIPERSRERHRGHRGKFSAEPRVRRMGAKLQLFGLRKDGTEFPVEISLSPIETAEGILVTSAIRDITERKSAEESRLRLASIVESSDDAIISKNLDGVIVSWNGGAQRIYGYTEAEALGKPITILVPGELVDEEDKILERVSAGERIEHYETVRVTKERKGINVSLSMSPIKDSSGMILGLCSISRDITPRKQMEEALSDMSRKLIESQEQERARIGRELHDDINQRLAMLSLELEQLAQNPSEVERRVQELRKTMAEISNDVQALSHDLHSSKLEYLGVVAGMKSWCKEFAERQKIEIGFRSDVSSVLPLAVGLSLFRVLQEALNNAIKHSGVKRIEVQLREDSGEIHLIVNDLGKGFDLEAALQGTGLGLTSMRERVRLVNGTISIESKLMGGTTIHVHVPLGSEKLSERAVG